MADKSKLKKVREIICEAKGAAMAAQAAAQATAQAAAPAGTIAPTLPELFVAKIARLVADLGCIVEEEMEARP